MNRMIKNADDIERIREGGAHLARILDTIMANVVPGSRTDELDDMAEKLMHEIDAMPAFKGYQPPGMRVPFNSTFCACINDEVVHAPAHPGRVLKDGDIFSIDIGMVYKGRFTDMAVTVPVGVIPQSTKRLLEVTRQSLYDGLVQIKPGNTVRDIGRSVQKTVEKAGYSIVRALVGHGVGYAVHEAPAVPNYDDPPSGKIILEPGMVLAIEPMVCEGNYAVNQKNDGWTIVSADHSLSAHFEHTIVVTKNGYEILTQK